MALPTLRRRSPLTASAARLGDREDAYAKRQQMPWQKRMLEYVDLIPELDYTSHFYERMMILLDIYPALRDDKGKLTRISEGPPVQLLDRIQDPSGGRSAIQGNYGRLAFITGEGCLFGRDLETDNERWLFVWNDELDEEKNSDGSIRKIVWTPAGEGSKREYGPNEAVIYRMWTPHPRRSGEADSPMRACQEIAEELIILTKSVRSTAVSRMAKGIFFLPSEISPGNADTLGDEDMENDPFFKDMTGHFSAQVENAGSAEANAPFVAHAAYDYIDRVRHIQLHDPQTDFAERELRSEAINRLAYGLDMPPEVLRGLGSTNHWAAMQILSDMWRSHGVRVGERWCDDLNDVYLRPALREMGYEDWKKVVIAYDDSRIVDRRELADPAADRGFIGGKGYRALTGISDDYAPTPKEHEEWLAIKTRGQGLRPAQPQQPQPAVLPPNPGRVGPEPPGPQGDSGRRTRIVASAARELGAAEMALMRCRELAGARLMQRRHQRDCPECLEAAKDAPLSLAASIVGLDGIKRLGLDAFSLVEGGADTLKPLLASWGYSDAQIHDLVTVIEVYAAKTVFDAETPSLPLAFMAQLEQMKDQTVFNEEVA